MDHSLQKTQFSLCLLLTRLLANIRFSNPKLKIIQNIYNMTSILEREKLVFLPMSLSFL